MLNLNQLAERIAAYQDQRIDLGEFEEWFRGNSWGSYDRQGEPVSDAIAAIDAALSSFQLGEIGEKALRLELATAGRPFASSVEAHPIWVPICDSAPEPPKPTKTLSVRYPVEYFPHERLGASMRAPVAACVAVALGMLAVPDVGVGALSSALTVEFPVVAPLV